ncbi:restriction endonuclease subunit S [Halothiobacillus sp.]|jgi:type I restriction enzyme S subunit|uniref:restriction endonuclease subunit S n=1 Tax=Halothiobacillus sp. TaxID=1891311 RepID=UPI002611C6F2|nr:restriction endonuclease subunit S [Halothiobacillus sp.]MDD4965978.1 restriction endonuclease subunit S [Halothiobacillus sp.]
MKAGWHTRSFEDCIEKVTYTTKIQRKEFLDAGAFPVVSQEDAFINGYWDGADDVFRVETPLVIFGDHTKVLKYIDFDFVLGADGVKLLLPREFLVPKFFYYQLQTAKLDSLGYARHYKLLKELEIKYPGKAEQRRIVAILDEAFDGIAKARANAELNRQNARALFESHLQSVFTQRGEGWVEASIGDICTLRSGTSLCVSLEKSEGEIPYVKVSDMTYTGNDTEIVASSRYLNMADIGKNAVFPTGTTIFPKRGGAILTNKKRLTALPICADLNIMGVIPPSNMHPGLLYFYFLNIDMRLIGSGSSIPQINNYDIAPLKISFPESQENQKKIVRQLEGLAGKTQRLESLYQQKLAALDELKKSLLHQAFSGQL